MACADCGIVPCDRHREQDEAYQRGKREGRAELLRELLPVLRDLLDDVSSPHHRGLHLARLPADVRALMEGDDD